MQHQDTHVFISPEGGRFVTSILLSKTEGGGEGERKDGKRAPRGGEFEFIKILRLSLLDPANA